MSDFDKEAEREKLREQFERDRQKRQQSERMSELLLKGATMTNKHHDCGSPIFRWEGEEFCPSCEGPNGAGGAADVQEPPADAESAPASSGREGEADASADATSDAVDAAADEAAGASGGSADADRTEIDVTTESSPDDGAPAEREPDTAGGRESTPTRSAGTTSSTAGSRPTDRAEPATDHRPAADEGVAAARASIERTLAEVAREAEATGTGDLARKRNLIAATREAAEALEATRRAGRQ